MPDHGETAFTVRCLKSQTCCDPDLVRRYLTANGYLSTFVAAFYIALDKNKSQVTKEGFNYLSLSLYILQSHIELFVIHKPKLSGRLLTPRDAYSTLGIQLSTLSHFVQSLNFAHATLGRTEGPLPLHVWMSSRLFRT